MQTKIDPSFHVTGNHPTRELPEADRADYTQCQVVCFQRGFEALQVAVYGDGLTDGDAEEAATEFLQRYHPNALRADGEPEVGIVSVKPCGHCGSITHPVGCCAQDGHGA